MLLSSFYSKVYLTDLNSRNFWFTPFSVYSYAGTHRTTLSICPKCLNTDEDHAHFRKHWRLSIQTICESCDVKMIDSCPNCGQQINHLIIEKGRKSQIPIFPITCCWKCLFDLKNFIAEPADPEQLKMQQHFKKTYENGYDSEHDIQYSHLYFIVLKKIVSLLNKTNVEQLIKFQKLICDQTGLEFLQPKNGRQFPFELMNIADRRNLCFKAYWILQDWPFRFREITAMASLRSKYFTDDFQDIPYWFSTELINNKVIFSEWRKQFPDYAYSSFKELAVWRVSKLKRKNSK